MKNLALVLSFVFMFAAAAYMIFDPGNIKMLVWHCFLSLFNYITYISGKINDL